MAASHAGVPQRKIFLPPVQLLAAGVKTAQGDEGHPSSKPLRERRSMAHHRDPDDDPGGQGHGRQDLERTALDIEKVVGSVIPYESDSLHELDQQREPQP